MTSLTQAGKKLASLKTQDEPVPQELRDELVTAAYQWIWHIVHRITARFPAHVDPKDLHQAGLEGFLVAIDNFQPDRNCAFGTYAEFRVRGFILDQIRRLDPVTREGRRLTREFDAKQQELSTLRGRAVTYEEVLEALNLNERKWALHLDRLKRVPVLWEDFEGGLDAVERTSARKDHGLEPVEWWLTLFQVLMSPQFKLAEREVLYEYYVQDLTLAEIGERRGVTESRACQIHQDGLKKLRRLIQFPAKLSGLTASSRSLN